MALFPSIGQISLLESRTALAVVLNVSSDSMFFYAESGFDIAHGHLFDVIRVSYEVLVRTSRSCF